MAKIAKQLTELIGNTPMLELVNYEKKNNLKAKIAAKLEYFNPLGSVKDRVANAMIEEAIKNGKINNEFSVIGHRVQLLESSVARAESRRQNYECHLKNTSMSV